MENKELLQRLETTNKWTSDAVRELRVLVKHENQFTTQAITDMRNETLNNAQLIISEMEILALELESE